MRTAKPYSLVEDNKHYLRLRTSVEIIIANVPLILVLIYF